MQGQLRLTGGRRIQSPRGLDTRPTTARVREAMMNILAPRLPGDTSEGALRLLLQFGLPPKAWGVEEEPAEDAE